MKISTMKFNDIAFSNNSENIKVVKTDDITKIVCKGSFFDADCINQLKALERYFHKKEKGVLALPELGCFYGRFITLEYEMTSTPQTVNYYFIFLCDENVDFETLYCVTLDSDDNFFSIAEKINVDFDKLVCANLGFTKSYFLNAGDKILLPSVIGRYM